MEHICNEEMYEEFKIEDYGKAIEICYSGGKGELFVSNDEYTTQVNFCPYCGFKALVQVPRK